MAKLYFRYGAMNCGKSTVLLQVAHNYGERNLDVLLIKPTLDTKGEDTVVSRVGIQRKVDVLANAGDDLFEIAAEARNANEKLACVLVDEAQFLTREQVNQLMRVATKLSIPVICYGLRTDFQTKVFPGAARLLEIAHSLEELKTICHCGKKSIFNARKVNGKFTNKGSQVAIDGKDEVSYESLCAGCYAKLVGSL